MKKAKLRELLKNREIETKKEVVKPKKKSKKGE